MRKYTDNSKFIMAFSVIAAILVICGLVYADNAKAGELPSYEVTALTSDAGESKQDFVQRVATVMHDWTLTNNVEACGSIAQGPAGWSIRIYTSRQPLACRWHKQVLPGYVESSETIHTHPNVASVIPAGLTSRERHAFKINMGTRAGGCNFSEHDRDTGPGYLVACGRIVYWGGREPAVEVGAISSR